MTLVSSWSIVCGEAPSKVVRTETTGWSTSAIRAPRYRQRRQTGNDDQRVDDQRQDRPTDEKCCEAGTFVLRTATHFAVSASEIFCS
jgi:hypothetical protein